MTLVATRHESHGGVLHNHMRWDSGDARVSKRHPEVNNRPVGEDINHQGEVARNRAMTHNEEAEGQIVGHDVDPAMWEIDPRLDHGCPRNVQPVMNIRRSGEGDNHHHPRRPRVRRRTGIPTLRYWMTGTGDGGRRGNVNGTLKRSMNENSLRKSGRGFKRWLVGRYSTRQRIKGSRTS